MLELVGLVVQDRVEENLAIGGIPVTCFDRLPIRRLFRSPDVAVFAIAAIAVLGSGCNDEQRLTSPRLPQDTRPEPQDPALDEVLQEYAEAFIAGDLASLDALLAPTFQYEIAPTCVVFAECGDTFPWNRETELAWLEGIIADSTERRCTLNAYRVVEMTHRKWLTYAGLSMSIRHPWGSWASCDGWLEVEIAAKEGGGFSIERMKAKTWLRDDDFCGLVHFRCFFNHG